MNHIQITNLSPLPEEGHMQLGLELWRQTVALAFGISSDNLVNPERDGYGPSLLEKVKEAIAVLEGLEGSKYESNLA